MKDKIEIKRIRGLCEMITILEKADNPFDGLDESLGKEWLEIRTGVMRKLEEEI